MRQRVAEARVARLATVTDAARPHLVPCCFVLERETIYSAVDAKPKSTLALRRLANIAANPGVSLLVDHYDEDWSTLWWVRVDGTARVMAAEADAAAAAIELLARKYEQYRRHPPPGPVIVVDIERWAAWP